MADQTGEFSVYWFDPEGTTHPEKRFVDAQTAVETARDLTQRPAALIGLIRCVMITDRDDYCNFEWRAGEGVVFPRPKQMERLT